MGTSVAVTLIGRDRPGIIAETTAALADLGVNIEDSTMTLLRGNLAMTLICATDEPLAHVTEALSALSGGGLQFSVREVSDDDTPRRSGKPYVLAVYGGDRPGIVSTVTSVVAAVGGNITDLTTRLTRELYVLIAEVDLPERVEMAPLANRLRQVGKELDVEVTLRPQETDVL